MPRDSIGRTFAPCPQSVAGARSVRIDRRGALCVAAGVLITGCSKKGKEAPTAEPATVRTDVPLRILLVGAQADAEAIRLSWSMTMEQSLDIRVVAPSDFCPDETEQLSKQMGEVDIAIVPQSSIGSIVKADAIVSISDDVMEDYREKYGKPFSAVANGLGSYGDETRAVPVGAKTFGLLAVDSEVQCKTWADYHDWVNGLDGKASEPRGNGWTAASFLNRCASSISLGWLFNRQNLKPEIDGPHYVHVLRQFAETSRLYSPEQMSPREIWSAIRRGKLKGGIGYETPDASTGENEAGELIDEFDVGVFNCPLETETDRVWFSQQTPLACITVGCRQTDASRQLIGWLTGGERIGSVRQQTELFSQTRSQTDGSTTQSSSAYARWLDERLTTPQVVPALTIPAADQYYGVLDQQVSRCISGDATPADALGEAAKQWEAITEQMGRKGQIVAWKRALGFGS